MAKGHCGFFCACCCLIQSTKAHWIPSFPMVFLLVSAILAGSHTIKLH